MFDRLALHTLQAPGFVLPVHKVIFSLSSLFRPPQPSPSDTVPDLEWDPYDPIYGQVTRQGNSQTNIYGNGNTVTTDQGANGWTPTVSSSVGDGATSSTSEAHTENPIRGGSSTASKTKEDSADTVSRKKNITYKGEWWHDAAAKALGKAVDHAAEATGSIVGGLKDGIQAGVGHLRNRLNGVQDTRLIALPTNDATKDGNTTLASASGVHSGLTYPPTPSVPLPTPDLPSVPGPSGDRNFMLDWLTWSEKDQTGDNLHGPNSCSLDPDFPISTPINWNYGPVYPLPSSLVRAAPDCPWTAMYNMHAMWNSGFRVSIVVNASQFHQGALVLFAFPENSFTKTVNSRCNYTVPYVVLNLAQTTQAELNLPYIGSTPNSTTMGMHNPWTLMVAVLSPLQSPVGSTSTSVNVSLFCSPQNSTFHGLRNVQLQHWKTRVVPGSGAFGSAVAGQELPLVGVIPQRPPVDYLPGRVTDWLGFARRPAPYSSLAWTMADEVGELLHAFPVGPLALVSTQTPLSFTTSLFSQWRGSIDITLFFVGCAQHYGRLCVAFTPFGQTPPTTLQEAQRGTFTLWDVNGNPELSYNVPFISTSYWRTVDIAAPDQLTSTLGTVSIFVQSPLSGPNSSPISADVIGFISAGPDFELRFMQNPVLTLQAGDDPPVGGVSEGEAVTPSPPDTFVQPASSGPVDTDLCAYFSFYRSWPGGDVTFTGSDTYYLVDFDPINAPPSFLSSLLSAFTYFTADLRVTYTVHADSVGVLNVAFAPPGATIPVNWDVDKFSAYFHSSFPLAPGTQHISFSIPYCAPYSALSTSFSGFSTFDSSSFGLLNGNTFGTLVLNCNVTGSATCRVAFGNFQGFIPGPVPATMPQQTLQAHSSLWRETIDIKIPKPVRPNRLETQSRPAEENSAPHPLRQAPCRTLPNLSLHLSEDEVYIVKVPRLTYNHWAIRRVKSGRYSVAHQIGLSNRNGSAVVSLEPIEGEIYRTVPYYCFEMVARTLGETVPYNYRDNCGEFITRYTGVKLPNTGKALALGLGVAAGALVAAQTVLGVKRQGLVDDAKNIAASMDVAASKILHAAQMINIPDAAASLQNSAQIIATSTDNLTSKISQALQLFSQPATNPVSNGISSFLKWLTKCVGYVMIVFGSPTPLSIAGLCLVILGDLSSSFPNVRNPFAAIGIWLCHKLGISCTQDEAEKVCNESQAGVDDFNKWALAAKNADWILDKFSKAVERILTWLGWKVNNDPLNAIWQKHDDVENLYEQSNIAVASAKPVDPEKARHNLSLARKLLTLAGQAKSTLHTNLLSKTIQNYSSLLANPQRTMSGTRPQPVVVYIHGAPGVGKSLAASIITRALASHFGTGPDDFYSPAAANCEFYDGYHGQPVHYIDDIGQDPEGKDWADIPQIVSSSPFIVPMAAVEHKGTFYTSKVIVMTSNFSGPNPRSVRCQPALERRLVIRLVAEQGSQPMDARRALKPDGPSDSKYFTFTNPLIRLESLKLSWDQKSLLTTPENPKSLDELVDFIVETVKRNQFVSFDLGGLIRQGLPTGGAGPSDDLSSTSSKSSGMTTISSSSSDSSFSTETNPRSDMSRLAEWLKDLPPPVSIQESPLEEAVKSGTPLSKLKSAFKNLFDRPLYTTALFASTLSSVAMFLAATLTIRSFLKKPTPEEPSEQGAYNGHPVPAPRTKPKGKPTPKVRGPIVRQSVPPGIVKAMRNCVLVSTDGADGSEPHVVGGFYLFSRFLVTVSHVLPTRHVSIEGISYELDKLEYLVHGEALVIKVPGGERPDLRRFVRDVEPHRSGFLIGCLGGGPILVRADQIRVTSFRAPGFQDLPAVTSYQTPSFPGLCGAPLFTDAPAGPVLHSVHFAGVSGYSGFGILLAPLLPSITQHFCKSQSSIRPVPLPEDGPTHVPRKSILKPSPAFGAFPVKKSPAPLTQKDPRLNPDVNLDTAVMSKHNKGDMVVPWKNLEAAASLYYSDYPSHFRQLSMSEAINGTPLLDGLDMSQASGYPWNTKGISRRELFIQTPDGYEPVPELKEAVLKCLDDPDYWYCTFLKDELRPNSKVEMGLTRAVEAAPLHAIIAGRMLCGGIMEHLQSHPGKYGSAVGCDPDTDWTRFHLDFDRFQEVWDLDYKCFDATLPSCAFDIVAEEMTKRTGDPRVGKYIRSIAFSKHVFGREAYEMDGGNPSGCVGTSIWNSMINNMCILSALMEHPDFNPREYHILTYGDDVLYATNPSVHPSFIKSFYDQHTPLIVTPASKTGDFPEHSSIYTCTFLKRHFVPDERFPCLIHPVIDRDTYEQSVMWTRGGPFQSQLDSLSYLAHHSGPNNYQSWVDRVRAQCEASGVSVTFLPYTYLQSRWLQSLLS